MMYVENTQKSRSKMVLNDKTKIMAYLNSVKIHAAAATLFYDNESERAVGGLLSYRDDAFAWTNETVYHFDKYNYPLPEAFIEHIRQKIT